MTLMQLPRAADRIRLTDAWRGGWWRVVSIAADDAGELLAEGLVVGSTVMPEARAPFRGPVIVRVGRARVAVARSVAGRTLVEPVERESARAGDDR
jgi:Fe2+ transport system protein FeoA